MLPVSQFQWRGLPELQKWKFIPAAVPVVCFDSGAGNLNWEETVLQGLREAEFCDVNQVCSHSKKNLSLCRISLTPSQLKNPSLYMVK